MDYTRLFEQFWEKTGKYLQSNNTKRTHDNIMRRLKDCNGVPDIEEYVTTLTNGKETNRKIMVAFFDYLKETENMQIDSRLYEIKLWDSTLERRLELAKYLHEPRELADIEYTFNISNDTRKGDIRALEEGIEFLGAHISIKRERRNGKDYYKSTMHPVFLPLNLTEVYAMTTYLDKVLDPMDEGAQIVRNISEKIKSQLSDYALNKLFPDERHDYAGNIYVDDETLAKQRDGIRMYLMKSGQPCKFLYEGEEYYGRLRFGDSEHAKEYIELESGEIFDADPKDVVFVPESLEYE